MSNQYKASLFLLESYFAKTVAGEKMVNEQTSACSLALHALASNREEIGQVTDFTFTSPRIGRVQSAATNYPTGHVLKHEITCSKFKYSKWD